VFRAVAGQRKGRSRCRPHSRGRVNAAASLDPPMATTISVRRLRAVSRVFARVVRNRAHGRNYDSTLLTYDGERRRSAAEAVSARQRLNQRAQTADGHVLPPFSPKRASLIPGDQALPIPQGHSYNPQVECSLARMVHMMGFATRLNS